MIDEREFEALLRDALGRAGAPAPFAVEVTQRVMSHVEELGTPVHGEIGFRQFIRWALAASVVGLAVLTAAFWNAPSAHDLASTLTHALAAAMKLSGPLAAVAAAFGRIGRAMLASGRSVVDTLAPFQILARALLTITATSMLAITAFVVFRDARVTRHKEL
jgi:hypothetical protein